MKKRLLCAFLFLTSVLLQAQTFEKAIFTHKTNQKTRTLKSGEHLKVKYFNHGKLTTAEGKLESVEDGVLYLFYQPGIPLDKVHKIRSGNPGLKKDISMTFKIGLFLIVVGLLFAAVFLFTTITYISAVFWGIGTFLIFVAFIMQSIGTHLIRDAGTAWEVETVMKAAPLQTP